MEAWNYRSSDYGEANDRVYVIVRTFTSVKLMFFSAISGYLLGAKRRWSVRRSRRKILCLGRFRFAMKISRSTLLDSTHISGKRI